MPTDGRRKVRRSSGRDFRSGKQSWSTSKTGQASVLVADGKLILLNDLGQLILARANPSRYEELARATLLGGEICWTAPTLYRRRVYVRSQTRAVCVYLGEPETLDDLPDQPRQTIATIPQRSYRDLTPLLGVEPELCLRRAERAMAASMVCSGTGHPPCCRRGGVFDRGPFSNAVWSLARRRDRETCFLGRGPSSGCSRHDPAE